MEIYLFINLTFLLQEGCLCKKKPDYFTLMKRILSFFHDPPFMGLKSVILRCYVEIESKIIWQNA